MKDLNAGKGGDSQSHFAKRRISNGPFAVKDSVDRRSHKGGYHDKPRASTQSGPSAHGTCTRAKNSEKSGNEHQNASCCEPCVARVDSTENCAAMMLDLEPGLIVKKKRLSAWHTVLTTLDILLTQSRTWNWRDRLRRFPGRVVIAYWNRDSQDTNVSDRYVRRSLSVTLILLDYERNIKQGCISTKCEDQPSQQQRCS
ncbi:hypothetical protein CSPX01_12306 [Colletotrichum filicis]|nr:hypothetical protein CSPX01_12306 [Colletotrichum filicis]